MVLNWGFIGSGRIAERIMPAFLQIPDMHVLAVNGRDSGKSRAFCARWNIERVYDSLDEMLADSDIDIIYIATPHLVHHEHTVSALRAGKHVLCEKPMAMSGAETEDMAREARSAGVFLMEGLWIRFFPIMVWLRDIIASGRLGKPHNVMADFCFEVPYDPEYRMFNLGLGGGSMLSAGIYPFSMAVMIFRGLPSEISAVGDMRGGVDLRSSALMRFPDGGMAQIYTGFQGESSHFLNISFEKGAVLIPEFVYPDRATIITANSREREEVYMPYEQPGFQFELRHIGECIRQGKTESAVMPLSGSAALARLSDEMYRQMRKSLSN
jgi:predicted dehydrogenase